jgi:adenine-specific DNA-methyltransferase
VEAMEFPKIQKEIYNPISENVKKLAELFPSAVRDGQVDFEALKRELGEFETVSDKLSERYELGWAGKEEAKQLANTDIVGRTLKYIPEDSKNPDTTENLYIEGDNLEVLKLLRNSYYNKIKMIYIDPPYNTGNDFIYKDNYAASEKENCLAEGEIDEAGERLIVNQKSNGKYHSNWLSMMYPRLRVAKDLLSEDGVIFISIDDNEVANVKKICNEIFGEENFVACLPTIMNLKGNNDQFGFAGTHEYTLVYAKNIKALIINEFIIEEEEMEEWEEDEYGYFKKGANLKATGVNAPREKRPNLWFPIYIDKDGNYNLERINEDDAEIYPLTNDQEMSWRWSKSKFLNERHNVIIVRNGYDISLYKKQRPVLGDLPSKKPKSIFYKPEYSSGNGTAEIKKIFDNKKVFNNPKPLSLIKDFIQLVTGKNDIIVDFLSGSATTAHAVMQLNAEDGGNRKFIMVQLPEPCDEKSEAYKAGFKNISEIGKERIRRAGEKIKEENKDKEGIEDLDIGFKVFKVADTNIRWFSEALKSGQMALDEAMMTDKDKLDFNPGFTDIDVVYEILLRHRDIPLSANVEKLASIGARTYIFAATVVVCLEENITERIIDQIAALEPMPTKVIFRDSAFGDDISLKTNSMLRLEAQMKKHSGLKKKAYRVEFI